MSCCGGTSSRAASAQVSRLAEMAAKTYAEKGLTKPLKLRYIGKASHRTWLGTYTFGTSTPEGSVQPADVALLLGVRVDGAQVFEFADPADKKLWDSLNT